MPFFLVFPLSRTVEQRLFWGEQGRVLRLRWGARSNFLPAAQLSNISPTFCISFDFGWPNETELAEPSLIFITMHADGHVSTKRLCGFWEDILHRQRRRNNLPGTDRGVANSIANSFCCLRDICGLDLAGYG